MTNIEKLAHRAVTRQWFIAYEQAMRQGELSNKLEKQIIDKIIKKFQELRTIL